MAAELRAAAPAGEGDFGIDAARVVALDGGLTGELLVGGWRWRRKLEANFGGFAGFEGDRQGGRVGRACGIDGRRAEDIASGAEVHDAFQSNGGSDQVCGGGAALGSEVETELKLPA